MYGAQNLHVAHVEFKTYLNQTKSPICKFLIQNNDSLYGYDNSKSSFKNKINAKQVRHNNIFPCNYDTFSGSNFLDNP